MPKLKHIILFIFLAGALIRLGDAFRPVNQASWREADLGAVSRNYARESMNFFYPRIDWRGNGEGFVEMEFPLYPYLTALSYELFGIHDLFGRLWSFLFSVLTLFVFYKLAGLYLEKTNLVLAFAFFTFNPLFIELSTAIQPESLMFLFYTAGVWFFLRWLETDSGRDFWPAAVLTALMILAKATAAHIGAFFAVLLFQKYGLKTFKQARVWLFAVLSLLPALLWYLHAKGLWRTYGNSLGVSNEYHWAGPDLFTNPYFIKGILFNELTLVFALFGGVAALFAVWKGFGEKGVRQALCWLASVFLMYIVIARTSADDWAGYYHIFSLPPAALLFGFGIKKLWEYAAGFADRFSRFSDARKLLKVSLILTVAFSIPLTFLLEARGIRANYLEKRLPDTDFSETKNLGTRLRDGLILASGGRCFDDDGYRTAYNESFMFYWLDRKGFNICVEDQSLEKVKEFAKRGAVYFVAAKERLKAKPGFERQLKETFPLTAETDGFYVFGIGSYGKP